MGDPFSIASGVAGLVSLGLTVCNGLHTYFSAIKDRKDDLAIVTQNLALFKFHIFAVQSSSSKLGHRHSPAIDGLQLSLMNCEMQLKCIESLLNDLTPAENPSLAKETWRRQKLIARYPFDRKKLVQLEEYLSRANITLSSFIQALNLDINVRMSDELQACKISLEALNTNTRTTLRTITTRLDFISPTVGPSTLQVVPSWEEDVTASSSNSIALHQTAMGAEMKSCGPGNERSFKDLTDVHSKARYLQNAELEQRLFKNLSNMNCTCGASSGRTSNRPASRTYRFWGGLTVSRQGDVRANHRPGSGKASPFDIDREGNNVAHMCLKLTTLETLLFSFDYIEALSNWPDGLRLLLQRQDVWSLMDPMDTRLDHLAPLDFALFYSKIYCNSADEWTDCDNCTCYVAVQLLLEADCNVTVGYRRPATLAGCSLKARKLFFKHLKDRRERLRNFASSVLPEETLRQYGVTANCFPDKTAIALWTELQEANDHRDRRVQVPCSLKPCNDEFLSNPESFFEYPHHLQVVELALDYGLAPKDEKGVPTLLSGTDIKPDWLLRQDLNLELPLEPFRVSILHPIAVFIGDRIIMSLRQVNAFNPHRDVCISELQYSRTLLPAICRSNSRCNIPCPCSSGEFSRPLAHVLPGILRILQGQDHIDSVFASQRMAEIIELVVRSINLLKLSDGSSEQSYMAICAIHILTMMSLGVRHLPICLIERYYHEYDSGCEEEDWKEILDEDRELIAQLQTLDEEFVEAFGCQDVPINEFLRGYWLSRIKEVIGKLNKPLADDDRYELLEAGVVLDEDETGGSLCRVKHPE
ncbi:uncharacterized protein FTJAE_6149 [Fusarium tjaetaba]|uniref:Fungal N-terminal domain-containing protein n=1 Tax=Fusarium tjaetaba TaxID=1567544 RepID=A0A8H5RMV0_9HYPO|nr:uncharacterized protein FTJAE_6149 [Fusarium tjaetaba]KAF5636252.1 hypothetical protein FTJAE_6149 [Fusarium tjaetaba]